MRSTTLCLAFAASAAPFMVAGEIAPGASLDEVRTALGSPKGQMHVNGRQVLYYERGAVELQAGRVTQVALRSPEEHAILTAREERMRAEREVQRSRLMAEGAALRDRKLANAAFLATPLAYQVSFWENFARSYPGVSCLEPLTIARVRFNEQLQQERRREEEAGRLAEGEERRLAAAERQPVIYPMRTYSGHHHGRRHHQEFGLNQITYNFNDTSITPYSVPSGNPAGSLTGSVITLPYSNPALPGQDTRANPGRKEWSHDECVDRTASRGPERGRGHRRDRM